MLFRRPYDADRECMPPARRREFSTPGGRNGQKPLSTAHPVTTCIRAEGINGHMAVGHGKGHQECEQKAPRNRPFSRRVSVAEIARRFSISAHYVSTGDVRFSTAFQPVAAKPLPPTPSALPAGLCFSRNGWSTSFVPVASATLPRGSRGRPAVAVVAGRESSTATGRKTSGRATASQVARNREKIPGLHIVSTTPAVGGNGAWCYLTSARGGR